MFRAQEVHVKAMVEREAGLAEGGQRESFSFRDSIKQDVPRTWLRFVSPWAAAVVMRMVWARSGPHNA